jgi:hypothetical protein
MKNKIFFFSPDQSGILCFFPLKKQRYSGEQEEIFLKLLKCSAPKNNN